MTTPPFPLPILAPTLLYLLFLNYPYPDPDLSLSYCSGNNTPRGAEGGAIILLAYPSPTYPYSTLLPLPILSLPYPTLPYCSGNNTPRGDEGGGGGGGGGDDDASRASGATKASLVEKLRRLGANPHPNRCHSHAHPNPHVTLTNHHPHLHLDTITTIRCDE